VVLRKAEDEDEDGNEDGDVDGDEDGDGPSGPLAPVRRGEG